MSSLNEERGEGKEPDRDDDDVSDVTQDDILLQVNCPDIVSPSNSYIQTSKTDEKGDPVVMVKTDSTVWKCIKHLTKKKIQESFMEYACSGEDTPVHEEMFMKNIVAANEAKIRVTTDGIEVAMDVPFELVVCVINYMTYLYIGDLSYSSASGQTKIMIDNLRANHVSVCRKCDLSSMSSEELREFVSSFIHTEDGRDGIMKVHEEYPGAVPKMLEAFMNESIAGRTYLSEMKNFVPRESPSEERSKFKEHAPVVDKETEFKEDKGKGKEEKEGESSKENTSLSEKMDGMRLGELKEPSGKIKVESKLIWQVFQKLNRIMELYGVGKPDEERLRVAMQRVMSTGHTMSNYLSSENQGIMHIHPEGRLEQVSAHVSCAILLALTLEPVIEPDSKTVSMTLELIRAMIPVTCMEFQTAGIMDTTLPTNEQPVNKKQD